MNLESSPRAGVGETPNEALAAAVADALVAAGLVPAEVLDEVRERVADGTAREADWAAWIRQGTSLAGPGGGDGGPR